MKTINSCFLKLLTGALLLLSMSCTKKQTTEGKICLEEFNIVDAFLDSMVNKIVTNINVDTTEEVLVLDMISNPPYKVYYLSVQDKDDVLKYYILWDNRRIVGYTYINNYPTIILSSVNYHRDFCEIFGPSLEWQNNTRFFDFMIMPKNRYGNISEEGNIYDWKSKCIMYEPSFFCFWQDKNGGTKHVLTKNPYEIDYEDETYTMK